MTSSTIVMIHGMWVGGGCWGNYQTVFEERGYRCLTPSLRHHDVEPTDAPPTELGTTSILDYADDLEVLIRSLDEPPIIMAHSMGGLIAQILLSRGLGERAVLIAPAPPADVSAMKLSVMRSFMGVFMNWGFWREPNRISRSRAEYAFLHELPPDDRASAYDGLVCESGLATTEIGMPFLDRKGATKVDATNVTRPMLIVGGALDRIVPASVVRKIAKKYERVAEYKEFANHSHYMLAEEGWRDVAEYSADWLDAAGSPEAGAGGADQAP